MYQDDARTIDFAGSVFLESSVVSPDLNRLNWRAEVLINRQPAAFIGKRVLDLACHDGRFTHAALARGAKQVTGVEARSDHVEKARQNLKAMGHDPARFAFEVADLVEYLRQAPANSFDTIMCFGVFSHLIEQVEILREVRRIAPSHFILDTWVAKDRNNFIERWRNHRVNTYVSVCQQGERRKTAIGQFFSRISDVFREPADCTGTLVFLYEDATAPGATIRPSGLMAWASDRLIRILFGHYGFECIQVDWRAQGVRDWSNLHDYRAHERSSWIACLDVEACRGGGRTVSSANPHCTTSCAS